jgi:putative DNA primase/helicase
MFAKALAHALGGRQVGRDWIALCPSHDDRTPSLSISEAEGKVLVYCHAGCTQRMVIEGLLRAGLWPRNTQIERNALPLPDVRAAACGAGDYSRTASAVSLWRNAAPASNTLVERYLHSRGILIRPPNSIRFVPRLAHPDGDSWPAMVALVSSGIDGAPIGIHRTFLSRDGLGKAPVKPQKMMLGPCRGGVIRLAESHDHLMIGEGVETCLSAMQGANRPAWSALSTSGLRNVNLPAHIKTVTVLADGDAAGESAATACAQRLKRLHPHVKIARAPRGMDFNSLLLSFQR